MPHELSIITATMCESVQHWATHVLSSTGRREYVVSYSYLPTDERVDGWFCDCPAFKYQEGKCKHITAAEKDHCQYGWEGLVGSPATDCKPNKPCPKCGGKTITFKVGV